MSEERKISRKQLLQMFRLSSDYVNKLRRETQAQRRHRHAVYERKTMIATDPEVIRQIGHPATVSLRGEYEWKDTIYLLNDLAELIGCTRRRVGYLIRSGRLTRPIFKGYHMYWVREDGRKFYKWFDCYVYEEVEVIVRHFREIHSRSVYYRRNSPERLELQEELEFTREEIKRRLRETDG